MCTIDVIIPTFRLEEKYLLPVLSLPKPEKAAIKVYLMVDNPRVDPPPSIKALIDNEHTFLINNKNNIGAAKTRNNGIAAGTGEWILFLDDDIEVLPSLYEAYSNAIFQFPDEIGFIGLVKLPEPTSVFTKAIRISGMADIFSIAERRASYAWGATANIMVKRKAMEDIRFSTAYPKAGGGEDVDFFLKVRRRNGNTDLKTLPEASVQHPWWENTMLSFQRSFRYGRGNSLLGDMNPEYTYYDFLNTPETIFVSLLVVCFCLVLQPAWISLVLKFMAGVLGVEVIASTIRIIKRFKIASPGIILYAVLLRLSYETGMLWGKISRLKWTGIGERFHDDGKINKLYFYRFNTYKLVKWVLYILLGVSILI